MGHTLTTLTTHLDVAGKLTTGPAAEHVAHARTAAGELLDQVRAVVSRSRLEPLTERELEILRLMASGIGNREIAAALALSEGTVKNRVSSIFSKLAVSDRTKAVLRAIAMALV